MSGLWLSGLAVGILCGLARPAGAWQGGGSQLEVEVIDPFRLSPRQNGFRPLTVKITARGGQFSQRDLPIWIVQRLAQPYGLAERQVVRHQKIVLPAGATSVTARFVARNFGPRNFAEKLHLELDGDLRFRTSSNSDFLLFEDLNQGGEVSPKLNFLWISQLPGLRKATDDHLLVDFDFAAGDPRKSVPLSAANGPGVGADLDRLLELNSVLGRVFGNELLGRDRTGSAARKYAQGTELLESADWLASCLPEHFPEQWQALVNVDVVMLNREEFAALSPRQQAALVDWLAVGGRLLLTGCGPEGADWSELPASLFGSRLLPDRQPRQPEWHALSAEGPLPRLPQVVAETVPNPSGFVKWSGGMEGGQVLQGIRYRSERLAGPPAGNENSGLTYFDYLLGRVLCTRQEVAELNARDWEWFLAAAYGNDRAEQPLGVLGRHNLAADGIESFRVEGVGEPPRLLFIFLISLFALVVGPLAYTVLYRTRRVNYLLAIVPALSLLATLGLLAYAIFAEGFAYRTACFSYTRLDQNTGQAVTLTETAVFSGVSPQAYESGSEDLQLVKANRNSGEERTELWDSGARLVAPEIRARTHHQVFTARVGSAAGELQVSRREVEGQLVITVRNELRRPLSGAFLRFEEGWYRVEKLAVGEEGLAVPAESGDFSSDFHSLFQRAGALGNRPDQRTLWRGPLWSSGSYSSGGEAVKSWGRIGLLHTPQYFCSAAIAPGEYVAISEESELAEHLKSFAQVQQQVHVIHGNW